MTGGVRRWIRTPEELSNWGGFPSVRLVPDGSLAGIAEGLPLPVEPVRRWQWLNMGRPQPNVNIAGRIGVISVMDTPSAPQRAHLFVTGSDGNVWCRWSTGTHWHWLEMGRPPGANIRGLLTALTVMDTPTAPQRPYVFVEGADANLWCFWWG